MRLLEQDCQRHEGEDPQEQNEQKLQNDLETPEQKEQNLQELESDIALLSAQIQAATYRLLCLVATYDELDGWAYTGFSSCAHWLAWRTGENLVTAREKVRVARALKEFPLISAAFSRAELSYSKVRAITRIATPENETDLVTMALEGTASQLERIASGVRQAKRLELDEAQVQHETRYLQYHYNNQGMLELKGLLPAEVGALVIKAMEAAIDALKQQATADGKKDDGKKEQAENGGSAAEKVSATQRQADALALIAESAMDHNLTRGNRADRYQVVVHVDAEALMKRAPVPTTKTSAEAWMRAELENGVGLCAETCRRLACVGSSVILLEDEKGNIMDPDHLSPVNQVVQANIGRKKRRLSAALERALRSRDRGCQFPGCTHSRYVEAHHLVHWADGGPTNLVNMVILCTAHHHAVHEQGFQVSRTEDGKLLFFQPNGAPISSSPRSLVLIDDPVQNINRQHIDNGLEISSETGAPTAWTGTRFDMHDAVHCCLPPEE